MDSYDDIDAQIEEFDVNEFVEDLVEVDPTQDDDLNNKEIEHEMQDYGGDEMINEYLEQDDSMI